MRLGKTAALHFGSRVVITLSGFAATFLIALFLGPSGLGQYSVALSLGFFWLVIPANGVAKSMKKRMSEGEDPAGFLGGGLALNAVVAAVGGVAILTAGDVLGGIVSRNREIMRVLITYDTEIAALFVGAVVYRSTIASLEGQKRVAFGGGLEASERVIRTAFQVVVLYLGLRVAGITLGHAGSLVVVAVAALAISDVRPRVPSVEQLRSLLEYAKFAWMGALRGRVFGWLDTLVLSFFVGASLIGIYEAAWGIASMLAMASASISRTLFPEVSDISGSEQFDQIRHYLDEALAFSGVFVIPGLFGALVLGERILRFYRPEFAQGTGILLILITAYLADVYASQLMNVVNAIDRPDVAFRVNVVFVAVNAVLNVVLVWRYGWYGAAVATAVSTGLRTVGGYVVLRTLIGSISVPTGEMAKQLAASVVMAVGVWPLTGRVPAGRPGTLVLVGFGAAIYGTVWLALSTRARTKVTGLLPVSI